MLKQFNNALFVLLIAAIPLFGQIDNTQSITKTGTSAAQFLKIGSDARATAMAGAAAGLQGDLSALHFNPAGLGYLNGRSVMFVHNQWLADMSYNYVAFATDLGNAGVIGLSLTSLTTPEDLVRTIEDPEGTGELFDASDLAFGLTFARRLTDKFSFGASVRYIQQRIWHESASTFSADIGALFVTPFRGIRLGAAITNFGGQLRMEGRDLRFSKDPDDYNTGNVQFVNAMYETGAFPIPLLFRVGLAGEVYSTPILRWTVAVDALHPNDNSESVNLGSEIAFHETFFVRTGYASLFQESAQNGLTVGAGLHYRIRGNAMQLKLDYSYADFGLLEYVQRFSLGFVF